MKCQYWRGKGLGCGHYGPENCAGHDMACEVKPTEPNPVPRFVHDELKAQNEALLAALKDILALWDCYKPKNVIYTSREDIARAAIAKVEAKP